MIGKLCLLTKYQCLCVVRGWIKVGTGFKNHLIIPCSMYVYAFMPMRGGLLCIHLQDVFACINMDVFYLYRKKKKMEAFGPVASWSNWRVRHVFLCVGYQCVFVKDP